MKIMYFWQENCQPIDYIKYIENMALSGSHI